MNFSEKNFYQSLPEPHYFAMKKILVTGAASGIGKACCIWLLNQGARVAMVGKEMPDLLKIGNQFPSQVVCIQSDLTIDQEHEDLINGVIENLGGLDILINAAGVIYENDLESTSPREHDYLMNINLRVAFSLSKLCIKYLKKSQGCIVNISSEWGVRPQQGMISYCMSKSGLDMLTKCLSMELAPIRVNSVAPGMTNTKFLNSIKTEETTKINKIKKNYANKNPLHRIARVDEIVKTIIFLCSKKAAKITGQIIKVDGGMNLTSSLFTHWDTTEKMNSKFAADGVRSLSRLNDWIDKKIQKFKHPIKNEKWVKNLIGDSNWDTNLADAHYKITDNYNKIEGEDNVLEALNQKKHVNGQIFTAENPKSARFIEDPGKKNTTSKSMDVSFKGVIKGLPKK